MTTIDDRSAQAEGLSRRELLGATGGALVLAAPGVSALAAAVVGPRASQLTQVVWLRRRADLMRLRVELWNVTIRQGQLLPVSTGASFLVFDFGPQSVAETTVGGAPPIPPTPGSIPTAVSGPSRIVFDVTGLLPLNFDTATLLTWQALKSSLLNGGGLGPLLGPPGPLVTALELPRQIVLSPDPSGGWAHSATPVDRGTGWTELWHTRFGTLTSYGAGFYVDETAAPPVHGIWLNDLAFKGTLKIPATDIPSDSTPYYPIPADKRHDIVHLAGDGGLGPGPGSDHVPAPLDVHRLMLSGLGGWLDAQASWGFPDPAELVTSVVGWKHVSTLGRDQYVRVTNSGFLFPFGHHAVSLQIAERRFMAGGGGAPAGFLHRYDIVVVREPVKDYASDPRMPNGARAMPFTGIRAKTMVTPMLLGQAGVFTVTGDAADAGKYLDTFLCETAPGQAFPFHFLGTDWSGAQVEFTCPVVFLDGADAADPALVSKLFKAYNGLSDPYNLPLSGKTGDFGNRKVTLAASQTPGDTELRVHTAMFGVEAPPGVDVSKSADLAGFYQRQAPPFYPRAAALSVEIPAAGDLTGQGMNPPLLAYVDAYVQGGFADPAHINPGAAFLGLAAHAAVSGLGFAADRSGAVATPNLGVVGVSRTLGPITGAATDTSVPAAAFDPATAFGDLKARILGGIALKDVIDKLTGGAADYARQAPQLLREKLPAVPAGSAGGPLPERYQSTLRWSPQLKSDGNGLLVPGSGASLEVVATAVVPLGASPPPPSTTVRGELRDVTVNLFGNGALFFLSVHIRALRFSSAGGGKPDVHCDIADVAFQGPLSYLQEIAKQCAIGGDGLSITPGPDRIAAALRLALPALPMGVLTLRHLAVSAGAAIPYDGSPARMTFDFCSRDAPFSLTVLGLGGGGFAGLAVGTDGVERLEFALEFGADVSVDLGVASGSVELKGGIYFAVVATPLPTGQPGQKCELTAYLRLHGELSVIGLVSMTLEFYLALSYYSGPDRLVGDASLTVSVDIAFFSTSVTISIHRELAKSGGSAASAAAARSLRSSTSSRAAARAASSTAQRTFGDVYPTVTDWSDYCAAFATVGA